MLVPYNLRALGGLLLVQVASRANLPSWKVSHCDTFSATRLTNVQKNLESTFAIYMQNL